MGPPYPYVRGLSNFPCPPMSLRSLIRLALAQYQRSRAGGDVSCRPAVRPHRPPSQEWHGVASGEACGVYVRVCGGMWGAECRTRLALHRAEQKETTDSLFPLFY